VHVSLMTGGLAGQASALTCRNRNKMQKGCQSPPENCISEGLSSDCHGANLLTRYLPRQREANLLQLAATGLCRNLQSPTHAYSSVR